MKRTGKAFLALFFTLILAVTCVAGTSAFARTELTYTRANQMARFTEEGYNNTIFGPITITEACFKKNTSDKGKAVYVVTLAGLDVFNTIQGGYNGFLDTQLAGQDLPGLYLYRIEEVMKKQIPKGANVMFYGHSLGGMVAQQLIAKKSIKDRYKVLYTVCFASPIIGGTKDREGTVVRFIDESDMVPNSSEESRLEAQGKFKNGDVVIREDGNWGLDALNAHNQSYALDTFKDYDVIGQKKGKASLTLDLDTRVFYKAQLLKLGRGND
ncbi:MAG: hypothetical protein J6T17_08125 [Clostridia bacterium]|nr:hypothetical protein [Clostridia bacterium]